MSLADWSFFPWIPATLSLTGRSFLETLCGKPFPSQGGSLPSILFKWTPLGLYHISLSVCPQMPPIWIGLPLTLVKSAWALSSQKSAMIEKCPHLSVFPEMACYKEPLSHMTLIKLEVHSFSWLHKIRRWLPCLPMTKANGDISLSAWKCWQDQTQTLQLPILCLMNE